MSLKEDDLDRIRNAGEGGPANGRTPEKNDVNVLYDFMDDVRQEFLKDTRLIEIEDAGAQVLKNSSEEEKKIILEMAERHFLSPVCQLHGKPLINYESQTLEDVSLDNIGIGLRAHLKNLLPLEEWEELDTTETKRTMKDEIDSTGTPG
jgi:hypothetical protein